MDHYRLGEKVDCKNATPAGLLGGLTQIGKKWFVSWGVIPAHDRRLVVMEELKGLPQDSIAKLTDMRSRGIAEIPKIEKRRAHARTRLIALSNPRSDRPMATYSQGVLAIKELIGTLEDIRRFDMALIVSGEDVSARTINDLQLKTMNVEHQYTSELCNKLILWAWTVDQVVFEEPRYLIERSIQLCERFDASIPLIDSGSMRFKLARLAAALAARTYSHRDHKLLYVRNCHVDYMAMTLERVYSQPSFGYLEYSQSHQEMEYGMDEEEARNVLMSVPNPEILVKHMLHRNGYDRQDFMDWTGYDQDMVQSFISQLTQQNALKRFSQTYYPTPPLLSVMRAMVETGNYSNRPAYLEEEEEF